MHLKTKCSKGFLQFSEVGWDPKVRRCAGAPRFYTIGISLYRTWNWTSRQVLHLENFRLPKSGFRKVGGSIITTAGESKDPPGFSNIMGELGTHWEPLEARGEPMKINGNPLGATGSPVGTNENPSPQLLDWPRASFPSMLCTFSKACSKQACIFVHLCASFNVQKTLILASASFMRIVGIILLLHGFGYCFRAGAKTSVIHSHFRGLGALLGPPPRPGAKRAR